MRFMLGDFSQKDPNTSKDNIHKNLYQNNNIGQGAHHQFVDFNNFGNAASPQDNRQFFTNTNPNPI